MKICVIHSYTCDYMCIYIYVYILYNNDVHHIYIHPYPLYTFPSECLLANAPSGPSGGEGNTSRLTLLWLPLQGLWIDQRPTHCRGEGSNKSPASTLRMIKQTHAGTTSLFQARNLMTLSPFLTELPFCWVQSACVGLSKSRQGPPVLSACLEDPSELQCIKLS